METACVLPCGFVALWLVVGLFYWPVRWGGTWLWGQVAGRYVALVYSITGVAGLALIAAANTGARDHPLEAMMSVGAAELACLAWFAMDHWWPKPKEKRGR